MSYYRNIKLKPCDDFETVIKKAVKFLMSLSMDYLKMALPLLNKHRQVT